MNRPSKFPHPYVVWAAVWGFIFLVILLVSLLQYNFFMLGTKLVSEQAAVLEDLANRTNWEAPLHQEAGKVLVFTLITYTLLLIGFGAICFISATYQNHFRLAHEKQYESEIEARDLRIQVQESRLKELDLRLEILDQDYEKALAQSRKAKRTIDRLEDQLALESYKNEELTKKQQKAQAQQEKARELLSAIEADRKRIELDKQDITARLEDEEKQYEDRHKQVRLDAVWLGSFYKNLSFSRRALKNLTELQKVSEVFPGLPDALAAINQASLESLTSKTELPPKNLTLYNTQHLKNINGPLWQYRFSSDGRIFFGRSKSRLWSIDTILVKRRLADKRQKYDKFLSETLGKDNPDLKSS